MYYKSFKQQFTSSIARDPMLRVVFNDMCALADRYGNVDMDYEAIAAITRWPVETIVTKIGLLMKPDSDSRSRECEGARLMLMDPNRAWGWRVINYCKYRNRQYDDLDKRRAYKREWIQKKRAAARGQVSTSVDTCRQVSTSVDRRRLLSTFVENGKTQEPNDKQVTESTVDRCRQSRPKAEAEAEAYKYPLPSPKGRQLQAGSADVISDIEEAKRLICERILNGKDPARPWSYQAMQELARQMPIPRLEVERIAWFRTKPNDGSPELEMRKAITENGLTAYWGDEVTRANAYWEKLYGWREKKKAAG